MIVDQAAQIYHKGQCEQINWASTCHMRSAKSLPRAVWDRSCVGRVQKLKMWCNRPWIRFKSRAASQCDTLQQDKPWFRISNSAQTLIISDIPVGHIQLIPQNELRGEERMLVAGHLQERYVCRFKCSPSVMSSFCQRSTQGHGSERRSTSLSIPLLQRLTNLSEGWAQVRMGQWAKQSWFGLGGGLVMGTDCRIPVWKAELILNFPEGISTGWNWGLEKIPGSYNSVP